MISKFINKNDNLHKKIAFTLAEVLITLGIIGVVAAMTIPTLNKKINEAVVVNKVTKNYATMSNALRMAINDHGTVDAWLTGPNYATQIQEFMPIFKKYLKVSEDCGVNSGCISNNIKGTDNDPSYYDSNYRYYKLFLADGSSIWARANGQFCKKPDNSIENVCVLIWYDYNGKKEPNTIGKDIFIYYVMKDRIIPHSGIEGADSCPNETAWACAAYILKYKKADYLKNLE